MDHGRSARNSGPGNCPYRTFVHGRRTYTTPILTALAGDCRLVGLSVVVKEVGRKRYVVVPLVFFPPLGGAARSPQKKNWVGQGLLAAHHRNSCFFCRTPPPRGQTPPPHWCISTIRLGDSDLEPSSRYRETRRLQSQHASQEGRPCSPGEHLPGPLHPRRYNSPDLMSFRRSTRADRLSRAADVRRRQDLRLLQRHREFCCSSSAMCSSDSSEFIVRPRHRSFRPRDHRPCHWWHEGQGRP